MSGLTGGIHLPEEEESTTPSPSTRHGFRFVHLNSFVINTILAASGMVAVEDFAFALFSLFYIHFLSKVAFPPLSPRPEPPVFQKSRLFGLYVTAGAVIGLILPIGYIFQGVYAGDKEGMKAAAAPHLFLLASQILMEGVTFSLRFSLPVRAFIPVFYNTRRIFAIIEWLKIEMAKVDEEEHGRRLKRLHIHIHIGRALATANLAFWCFNLFGFLLPFYIPMVFKRYYGHDKVKD
ncbi:hypothetical protein ACLOJK_015518 [Asimina triloba]